MNVSKNALMVSFHLDYFINSQSNQLLTEHHEQYRKTYFNKNGCTCKADSISSRKAGTMQQTIACATNVYVRIYVLNIKRLNDVHINVRFSNKNVNTLQTINKPVCVNQQTLFPINPETLHKTIFI